MAHANSKKHTQLLQDLTATMSSSLGGGKFVNIEIELCNLTEFLIAKS